MFTAEQRQKALVFVSNELKKRAVLDAGTEYDEEIEGIVDAAEGYLFKNDHGQWLPTILTGQQDAYGNDVVFTASEIEKAALS